MMSRARTHNRRQLPPYLYARRSTRNGRTYYAYLGPDGMERGLGTDQDYAINEALRANATRTKFRNRGVPTRPPTRSQRKRINHVNTVVSSSPDWVSSTSAAHSAGCSTNSIGFKIRAGLLTKGRHWIDADDGSVYIRRETMHEWASHSMHEEPSNLSEAEIVSHATKASLRSGVYFLIKNGRVIYVGQSGDVYARLSTWSRKVIFDSYYVIPCAPSERRYIEAHYINSLQPELNAITAKV